MDGGSISDCQQDPEGSPSVSLVLGKGWARRKQASSLRDRRGGRGVREPSCGGGEGGVPALSAPPERASLSPSTSCLPTQLRLPRPLLCDPPRLEAPCSPEWRGWLRSRGPARVPERVPAEGCGQRAFTASGSHDGKRGFVQAPTGPGQASPWSLEETCPPLLWRFLTEPTPPCHTRS